ncbi:unnamed protein product [Ostreobium quekettii]|uniref:Uncharacterized protein n=1 Tax=Ostreobium quekettii TaxID=121088 RepID=A0A8S1IYR0_9CHLO|nr:unnamed protein product [Ostreobium quekettii]
MIFHLSICPTTCYPGESTLQVQTCVIYHPTSWWWCHMDGGKESVHSLYHDALQASHARACDTVGDMQFWLDTCFPSYLMCQLHIGFKEVDRVLLVSGNGIW